MSQRYSISEFENLWEKDPERYGCIPLQLAVESLEMDKDAFSMLIDKGAMELIKIGNEDHVRDMVSLRSLMKFKLARMAQTKGGRPERLLKMLTEAAKNRKTLVYGDVMKLMGLIYKEADHRDRFTADLRKAVELSELYEHNLIISCLLVFKIQFIAHDDFFIMAEERGLYTAGKDSKTVFFKEHMEAIFQYFEKK